MHLWRITNILKNKQEIGKIGEDIACSYLEKIIIKLYAGIIEPKQEK